MQWSTTTLDSTAGLLRDPEPPPVRHVARHRLAVLITRLDRGAHVQLHVIRELPSRGGGFREWEFGVGNATESP